MKNEVSRLRGNYITIKVSVRVRVGLRLGGLQVERGLSHKGLSHEGWFDGFIGFDWLMV